MTMRKNKFLTGEVVEIELTAEEENHRTNDYKVLWQL